MTLQNGWVVACFFPKKMGPDTFVLGTAPLTRILDEVLA